MIKGVRSFLAIALGLIWSVSSSVAYPATTPAGKEYDIVDQGLYYQIGNDSGLILVDADWTEQMVIPASVEGRPVTQIAPNAFEQRIDIESLTLDKGLVKVGKNAFNGCTSLVKLDISNAEGVTFDSYSFAGSGVSGDLVFPDGVVLNFCCFSETNIESVKMSGSYGGTCESAFSRCRNLKKAEMGPKGKIGQYMFLSCGSLEYISLPQSCTTIGKNAFEECVALSQVGVVPSDLRTIGYYAFHNCSSLASFEIPESLESAGGWVFFNSGLTEIRIPDGFKVSTNYKSIGECFGTLPKLEKVHFSKGDFLIERGLGLNAPESGQGFDVYVADTLWTEFVVPASVSAIARQSYANVRSLKKVIVPNKVTAFTIGDSAFENCAGLETVEVGAGSISFGNYAFKNCVSLRRFSLSDKNKCNTLSKEMFCGCTSLQDLSMDKITVLSQGVFKNTGLVFIDNSNIVELGPECFAECPLLSSVVLENAVTMGWECFYNCQELESVNLPSVKAVNRRTFDNCIKLQKLLLPAAESLYDGSVIRGCVSLHEIDFSSVRSGASMDDCVLITKLVMPKLEKLNFRMPPNLISADFPIADEITSFNGGFNDLEKLETVNIPLIRIVPNSAFKGCKSLKNINCVNFIEIHDDAFNGCSSLAEVNFGPLTKIGRRAFAECSSLETVIIPETVTDLSENEIFKNCSGIRKLEVLGEDVIFCLESLTNCFNPEDSELIFHGNVKFSGSTWLGTNLKKLVFKKDVGMIPYRGFLSDPLTSITFCGAVEGFEGGAFKCPNLKEIRIADIDNWLTLKCDGADGSPACLATGRVDYIMTQKDGFSGFDEVINHVEVPNGTDIRRDAFIHGTLKSLTILPGEESSTIGEGAFYDSDLEEVELGEGLTKIGKSAFEKANLRSVILPESVTSVGDFAFQSNANLESFTFSPNMKSIPNAVLAACPSLKYLNIPEGVENIGYGLVSLYGNLKFISLPSTLKSLSNNSKFGSLHNLLTDVVIYSYSKTVPQINKDDLTNVTVHVPSVSLDAYKLNQKWSKANLIGDLEVDHSQVTDGTTIIIDVPVQSVDVDNKVYKYEVVCYSVDNEGNRLDGTTYVFDADGNPIVEDSAQGGNQAAFMLLKDVSSNICRLAISNLDENTDYEYEVKGYTNNRSLVYKASGEATTSINTGILVIDMDSIGPDAMFFDLKGNLIPGTYDSLAPGVYVCRTPELSFKFIK